MRYRAIALAVDLARLIVAAVLSTQESITFEQLEIISKLMDSEIPNFTASVNDEVKAGVPLFGNSADDYGKVQRISQDRFGWSNRFAVLVNRANFSMAGEVKFRVSRDGINYKLIPQPLAKSLQAAIAKAKESGDFTYFTTMDCSF